MIAKGMFAEVAGAGNYTAAQAAAMNPTNAMIICVTDMGTNGVFVRGNGTRWVPLNGCATLKSAYVNTSTTSATETTLANPSINPVLMKTGDRIRVRTTWSFTGSTNTKTMRGRLNTATTGDLYHSNSQNTSANVSAKYEVDIMVTGTDAVAMMTNGNFGAGSVALTSSAPSLSSPLTLIMSGQTNGTETLTLVEYDIEWLA